MYSSTSELSIFSLDKGTESFSICEKKEKKLCVGEKVCVCVGVRTMGNKKPLTQPEPTPSHRCPQSVSSEPQQEHKDPVTEESEPYQGQCLQRAARRGLGLLCMLIYLYKVEHGDTSSYYSNQCTHCWRYACIASQPNLCIAYI